MKDFQGNTAIGIISGCLGGLGKYFLQIQTPFLLNILGAIITALLCGAAGVAGKEGYMLVKNFLKNRKRNGIKKQN